MTGHGMVLGSHYIRNGGKIEEYNHSREGIDRDYQRGSERAPIEPVSVALESSRETRIPGLLILGIWMNLHTRTHPSTRAVSLGPKKGRLDPQKGSKLWKKLLVHAITPSYCKGQYVHMVFRS